MRRSTRDADYRGQKTTVNWGKLTYLAFRKKPGALEVLQDAILTYFPKQFKRAQAQARLHARKFHDEIYVYFQGTIARRRFEPAERKKKRNPITGQMPLKKLANPRLSPFFPMSRSSYLADERRVRMGIFERNIRSYVIVWSTKHGLRIGDVR